MIKEIEAKIKELEEKVVTDFYERIYIEKTIEYWRRQLAYEK